MKLPHLFLACALLVTLILSSSLSAGEKVDVKGKWALQFGIQSDIRLTSFQGNTLSLQKTTMSGTAWRLGLGLNLSTQHREDEDTTPDSSYISNDNDQNTLSLELTVQRLFKLNTSTKIRPYLGVGPLVHFYTSSSDVNAPNNPIRSTDRDSWALGLRGVLGAEWFVTDYLSLLGEYTLDATFDSITEKRTTTYDSGGNTYMTSVEIRTDGFHIGSGYTQLAASLYF